MSFNLVTGKAKVVIGLGFGDEGKGTMVDYLVRETNSKYVVRFCGGSQAAHNVVTDVGKHHTFAQFGSGAFAGAGTIYLNTAMFDPIAWADEAATLSKTLGHSALDNSFLVEEGTPIITPFHVAANRLRERARGTSRHGSCGKGIGELGADLSEGHVTILRVEDLYDLDRTISKLTDIQSHLLSRLRFAIWAMKDELTIGDENLDLLSNKVHPARIADSYLELSTYLTMVPSFSIDTLLRLDNTVWEGSQGVLLDEDYGFHPHTTWSKVTPQHTRERLGKLGVAHEVVGVTRTFFTRHGAGPFPTEDMTAWDSAKEQHNGTGEWQGSFRVGAFDEPLFKYAVAAANPDSIALTHLDVVDKTPIPVYAYAVPVEENTEIGAMFSNRNNNIYLSALAPMGLGLEHQAKVGAFLESIEQGELVQTHNMCCSDKAIKVIGRLAGRPVTYLSYGPRTKDKRTVRTSLP